MKFSSNIQGSSLLGEQCSITHARIIIMKCQSHKDFLKPPSNPCFTSSRQFHSLDSQRSSIDMAPAIEMAEQMCHPIAVQMLTYADVVKLLPADGSLPKSINFKMPSATTMPQNLHKSSQNPHIKISQNHISKPKLPLNLSSGKQVYIPHLKSPQLNQPKSQLGPPKSPQSNQKLPLNSSLGKPATVPQKSPQVSQRQQSAKPQPSSSSEIDTAKATCSWRNQKHSPQTSTVNHSFKNNYTNFQSHKVPDKKTPLEKTIMTSPQLNRSRWKKNNNISIECKKVFLPKQQRSQNKFWQKTPNILSCSWRTNSNGQCAEVLSEVKIQPNLCSGNNKIETKMTEVMTPAASTEISESSGRTMECDYNFRDRRQSESSQTSEDSFVVFDRDSGCSYESEVSSDESDSDEDSDSDDESTLSDSSVSSVSHAPDSGLTSDSEDESHTLQVGDSARLSLPPRQPVPPARTQSRSSLSDTDSDDDFIVFGSESEEEDSCDDEPSQSGETEVDGTSRRSNVKVRFAEKEEICYLYDDDDARQARCGEWEEMARDRSRFRARINSAAEVLGPILDPEHREHMYKRITQKDNERCKTS